MQGMAILVTHCCSYVPSFLYVVDLCFMLSLQSQPDAITSEQCDLIQSTWKEVARPKNSTESNVIGLTIGMAFYDVCVVGGLYRIGPGLAV
jgi:hypothetical protein